jgi:uncharacterized LabA/DUF88 family protein
MDSILFIDGRNFLSKINSVLYINRVKDVDFSLYDFGGLIKKVLKGIEVDRKLFYFGKLIRHEDTAKKSIELIESQRKLKTNLEKQEFEIIIAGRIRGHLERCSKGHETLVFKEKGVDVKIAVDMVKLACNNKLKTAIIGSSDSDLQPAISELKERKVERIYLGFENIPNKGLTYTTDRTILIRNSEVLEFLPKTLFK